MNSVPSPRAIHESLSGRPLALVPVAGAPAPDRPARRFVSLGTKLTLATIGVLLLVSGLVFWQQTSREWQSLLRAKRMAAAMVADVFASSLAAPLHFQDEEATRSELEHLRSNRDLLYAAVCAAGSTKPVAELGALPPGGGAPCLATAGPSTEVLREHIELRRPIVLHDGKQVGRASLYLSLAPEQLAFDVSRKRLFIYSLLLALGTALPLVALTRRQVVGPLRALAEGARALELGRYAAPRVAITSGDEIGRLGGAFESMAVAIIDREERLAGLSRDLKQLFDHMRQAIVAFGPGGRLHGTHSRQAALLFGARSLHGSATVEGLLYGTTSGLEATAFAEWVTLAFEVPAGGWVEVEALAPTEVTLRPGEADERSLELEFRPIYEGDRLARVMMLATDVTERRRLEREVRENEERYDRQMAAMRRLLGAGGQAFVTFLRNAGRRLDECAALLAGLDDEAPPAPDTDLLFRHAHTTKAEARAFELRELEACLHEIESQLTALQTGERASLSGLASAPPGAALAALVDQAREALARATELFVSASPIGRAALDEVSVRRGDLESVVALAGDRDDRLGRAVGRLASRPFGELLAPLTESVGVWASRYGAQVALAIDGREAPVPPALARLLGGVLTHLVRNAVAHGVEPPDERVARGKAPEGVVRIGCETAPGGGVRVRVDDDGRGLDIAALRMSARRLTGGGSADPRGGAELAFVAGLSTAPRVDEFVGRGVGLAAVRADLDSVGYTIRVESEPGAGTTFVIERAQAATTGASS